PTPVGEVRSIQPRLFQEDLIQGPGGLCLPDSPASNPTPYHPEQAKLHTIRAQSACPSEDSQVGRARRTHRASRCHSYPESMRSNPVTPPHHPFQDIFLCRAIRSHHRLRSSIACCFHPPQT